MVIEEGLDGPECSLMVLCDGRHVTTLVPSQDFKRVGDGDVGANTGGMGAYAPMDVADTGAGRRHHGAHRGAHGPRAAAPRHRLPRRPLRRDHADVAAAR